MTSWLYLATVVGAGICIGLLDHRLRLVFAARPRRALVVVTTGAGFFLAWDVVAIELSIYRRGNSPAMTGIEIAPHLPLEELFFVAFLCYLALVVHGLLRRLFASSAAGPPGKQS